MIEQILKSTPATGDPALDPARRGLNAEAVVLADMEKLKTDPEHRAAVRKILLQRRMQVCFHLGYRCRPWLRSLKILADLDNQYPLESTDEDRWVCGYAEDQLGQMIYNASVDPKSWWHSEALWRKFCADRQWTPEDHL